MDIKICEKKQNCGHFLIEKLVQELGWLGNEDGLKKIKSGKQFRAYNRKIKSLGRLVREFESEVVEFFDVKGFYPCFDSMQICWGRRKYQVCKKNLEKTDISKMEVKK